MTHTEEGIDLCLGFSRKREIAKTISVYPILALSSVRITTFPLAV